MTDLTFIIVFTEICFSSMPCDICLNSNGRINQVKFIDITSNNKLPLVIYNDLENLW